jgi:hypothetical protein
VILLRRCLELLQRLQVIDHSDGTTYVIMEMRRDSAPYVLTL